MARTHVALTLLDHDEVPATRRAHRPTRPRSLVAQQQEILYEGVRAA